MGLDLVHDGALDVLLAGHAARGDEDVALAGRREGGEGRLHDDRERQAQPPDLLAHTCEERAGTGASLGMSSSAVTHGDGVRERLVTLGDPLAREDASASPASGGS